MEKIYKWYLRNRLTKRKEAKKPAKNTLPALRGAKEEFDCIGEFENQRTRNAETQTDDPGADRPVSASHSPKFSVRPARATSPIYLSSARRAKSRPSAKSSGNVSAKSADNDQSDDEPSKKEANEEIRTPATTLKPNTAAAEGRDASNDSNQAPSGEHTANKLTSNLKSISTF